MPLFTATFNAVGVTVQQDCFELVAGSDSRVLIRQIVLGQYSDFGDVQDEILSVLLIRNHGTAGSGGTAVTPANLDPYSRAASSTVAANNTTVATNGSNTPQTVWADAFNIRAGWSWSNLPFDPTYPYARDLILKPSQRLVVRINSTPVDSITMNGTLVFEEIGKMP